MFLRIVKRAFTPPLRLVPLIAAPIFALLAVTLLRGLSPALASPVYLAALYALTLVILAAVRAGRILSRSPLATHPLLLRWRSDVHARVGLTLAAGLATNLAFAVFKLAAGVTLSNDWLIALGGYYAMLALLRALLLSGWRGALTQAAQWRRYRACGVVLVPMNQALMVVVIYLVHRGVAYDYPGHLIYAMALYAFYAVIAAVVQLLRPCAGPLIRAARAVSLVCALVSLLALQTAIIARFDESGDPSFATLMNSLTGGAVCVIVLIMGLAMVLRANRALRALQSDANSA